MGTWGKGKVLVVDDEPNAIKVLSAILSEEGFTVFHAYEARSALRKILAEDVDAVITDMKMPGKDGVQLYEEVRARFPDIPVMFLTAHASIETAVHTMNRGAYYYFLKPPDYQSLKEILGKAIEQRQLKRELVHLKDRQVQGPEVANSIYGHTPEMLQIFDVIETVKDSQSSVLVCGETGTGKELIARSLHFSSERRDHPFVAVNCAAIPRELIEAELFGCEKGAFTGAVSRRIGRVEQASGGTLFLDEIGELDIALQAKLLRVLQEKEIERLGSNQKIRVDFRLISSTNRNLKKEIQGGSFREDLFYRINVVQISVPPLRDRRDDIPLLVSKFLKEFCARENKVLTVSEKVMKTCQNYHWPGNVRQLKNVLERAVVLGKGKEITLREIPEELFDEEVDPPMINPSKTLKEMEVLAVKAALERCHGNKTKASQMLGLSRKALYKRLSDFHISY